MHCRFLVSCLPDNQEGMKPRCVSELRRSGVLDSKGLRADAVSAARRVPHAGAGASGESRAPLISA